jgi:hypothetical protein
LPAAHRPAGPLRLIHRNQHFIAARRQWLARSRGSATYRIPRR